MLEGASVLWFAVGIKAAFIADADGTAVEGATMSAYFVKAAVLSDGTIFPDVVVITNVDETTSQVVALELLGGVVLGFACGGTVDDDVTDGVVGHVYAGLNLRKEFVLGGDLVATDGKRKCFLDHRSIKINNVNTVLQFYSSTVLPCKM